MVRRPHHDPLHSREDPVLGLHPRLPPNLTRDAVWTTELVGTDWEDGVAEAITHEWGDRLTCNHSSPVRQREARILRQGLVGYQVTDPNLTLSERIDLVRRTLLWIPTRTNYAMIRTEMGNLPDWHVYLNPYPHVAEPDVRYNIPLLASMVPDANGIQLLTDAHLRRAHDLDNWTITTLPGGRHLVEHHNLEAWYTAEHPDPTVLAEARKDFGAMIMTPTLIRENTPWT